jgi:hypothetical protein
MSSTLKNLGGMVLAAALWSSAHAQGLVTEKNISLAMAQTIANAAMEKCKEMGFRVSVTVVDRAGLAIVMLRGDGAGLHTPEGSDRKAYTARTFRAPSADFVQRMLNDPGGARLEGIHSRARARRGAADQGRRRRGRGSWGVRVAGQ